MSESERVKNRSWSMTGAGRWSRLTCMEKRSTRSWSVWPLVPTAVGGRISQQNLEGSVTLLTDTSGNAIERYRYDAFGAPTIYTSTWGVRSSTIYDNRFLFTGREYAATYRSTYNS